MLFTQRMNISLFNHDAGTQLYCFEQGGFDELQGHRTHESMIMLLQRY